MLEPVRVAAGEVIRLFDDAVPADPTGERAEPGIEPIDFGWGQVGELLVPDEPC